MNKNLLPLPNISLFILVMTPSVYTKVPTACSWKSPAKGKIVVNFASTTMHEVTIAVFAAEDGVLNSEIRSATFTVAKADEDFSIGLGASRVKFKENEL